MTTIDPVDPHAVAAGLRAVLAAVAAGDVEAQPAERAYLAGALDALEKMVPE
jgi:hypothetical protein